MPYLNPELTGQRLLVGANFASAGIGILNDTGIQFVIISQNYLKFVFIKLHLYVYKLLFIFDFFFGEKALSGLLSNCSDSLSFDFR